MHSQFIGAKTLEGILTKNSKFIEDADVILLHSDVSRVDRLS